MARSNKLIIAVSPAALADAFEQFDNTTAFAEGIIHAATDFNAKYKAEKKSPTFTPPSTRAGEPDENRAEKLFGPPTKRPRATSVVDENKPSVAHHPKLVRRSGSESAVDDILPGMNPIILPPPKKDPQPVADPATEAPELPVSETTFQNIGDDELIQLAYGMDRVFPHTADINADRASFSFSSSPQSPHVPDGEVSVGDEHDTEPDQDEVDDDIDPVWDVAEHKFHLDGLIADCTDDEVQALDDWFSSFPKQQRGPLDELGPVDTRHERVSLVREEAQEEHEDKKKKKKKEEEQTFDLSPTFIWILLANGQPLVPYSTETLAAVGNVAASRFATTIKIDDRKYTHSQLSIDINVCYGATNLHMAQIQLAMDDLVAPPRDHFLTKDTLATCLQSSQLDATPEDGAFLINFDTTNDNSAVYFKNCNIAELRALQMPGLSALQNQVEKQFSASNLNLTILVTEKWKDFEDWGHQFAQLYANSHLDPFRELKEQSRGQPITIRNYKEVLPTEARALPAKTRFRGLDEALTCLGDASAREHAYEKWSSQELAKIHCKALIMPIGSQTCVLNRDGTEVEVPYLYSFSVMNSSNPALFAQLAPALNAGVKIQVEIPYSKVATPVENKTEQEIVQMIAKGMQNELWSHRRKGKVPKELMEQAWVDDYAKIIKPYVKEEKFNNDDDIICAFAYLLSQKLQKFRTNEEEKIQAETPKEHRQRTVDIVNQYRDHLKVAVDVSADIPQFTAVRMAHEDPLSKLSEFQFVAFRPKQMGWPKAAAATSPAPYLDFREPRTPRYKNYDHLAKIFEIQDKKRDEKYLVSVRFVAVDDDVTAKSKVQGLIKMKEHQATPVAEWFTTFKGNPITSNITDSFSILRRIMHHRYYDAALPFSESEEILAELTDNEPLRDAKGKVIEVTTSKFQIREAQMTQRLLKEMESFSEEQMTAFNLLTKAPFGLLVIEGVPGSGKTRLAHAILRACMYSSIDTTMRTTRQPDTRADADQDSSDSESEDERYSIQPSIAHLVADEPAPE
ncbi:hypothetical protein SLS63_002613 [Diaporthe eres]|uniref:DNA2/NAM7 helicase helicase domain-containing protein n=1 Tax=Diaporthe eres TaxID=83184 RepID=A0ABR1PJU8_DIAER